MSDTIQEVKALIEKDYQLKVKKFEKDAKTYPHILIGDSMAAYLSLSAFGLDDFMNQGIAGDTTIGVLKRLELVIRKNPKTVWINIGSNDIVLTDLTAEETVDHILDIKHHIESKTDAKVFIFSMTPVLRDHQVSKMVYIGSRDNTQLKHINELLSSKLSKEAYINIYDQLKDSKGNLNVDYTTDGIHLNKSGYKIYVSEIKKRISAIK